MKTLQNELLKMQSKEEIVRIDDVTQRRSKLLIEILIEIDILGIGTSIMVLISVENSTK